MRVTPYREAVRALMRAAAMTRPDVAYPAHHLENLMITRDQHTGGRRNGHYNTCGARRALGSPTLERRDCAQKLSAWVDTDFATCPDTRRSVSGGAVICWGGGGVGVLGSRGCRR